MDEVLIKAERILQQRGIPVKTEDNEHLMVICRPMAGTKDETGRPMDNDLVFVAHVYHKP